MLPVTPVISAPLPEHLFLEFDLGILLPALLLALLVSSIAALVSALAADRERRPIDLRPARIASTATPAPAPGWERLGVRATQRS